MSLDHSESRSEPKALRKLARQNKYDIKAVLWCPHQSQQDLLASTVSRSEVWEKGRWRGGEGGKEGGTDGRTDG